MTVMTSQGVSPGLVAIRAEMARQHADALASFSGAASIAGEIAASIRRTGRLHLVGMGGSHFMNRVAEALFRTAGVDAVPLIASEVLYTPLLASQPCTTILVSQSGGSAEIIRLLDRAPNAPETFGLTINGNARLGQSVPSLVGVGGEEKAYAATRSLLITLALQAAVLQALGQNVDRALEQLSAPPAMPEAEVAAATDLLAERDVVIFSGRTALQGVAESGALCLMELARMPALALEGGQFRHGPLEILSPRIGVVLLRGAGETAKLVDRLGQTCVAAGITPLVFDASGEAPIAGAFTLSFPRLDGLAAALAILPVLQDVLVRVSARRVADVGVPRRSAKVTDTE